MSLVIGEVPTAILVALLVVLNVVLGARQELTARASAPIAKGAEVEVVVNPARAIPAAA